MEQPAVSKSALSESTAEPHVSQSDKFRELSLLWAVLTATLLYLEVPLRNAPLFAAVLVSQACLGGLIIARLLKGTRPSLLLLCGPGLILGGAVSFTVFQSTGRGVSGTISTIAVNSMGLLIVLPKHRWANSGPRWWTLGQLLGLAATSFSFEHKELLPISVLLFVVGSLSDPSRPRSRVFLLGSWILVAIVCSYTLMRRQEYWWLITDDYSYFEVISRHLAKSSPFADWGVENFLTYHWLPYGWSGLLDILGGNPQPFVTLTRVMPLVYSLSLAASLMLLSTLLGKRTFTFSGMTSVWIIVIFAELDWSGTGTAGVYSVLASLVFLMIASSHSREYLMRKLVLVGMFLLILLLTKLPSIFVVALITSVITLMRAFEKFPKKRVRLLWQLAGIAASMILTIGLVWIGSVILKRFEFVPINRQLGQLADSGRLFAGLILALSRSVVWVLVVYAGILALREHHTRIERRAYYLPALCTALAVGSVLELIVQANADNHRYISGPMFFIATLSTLLLEPLENRTQRRRLRPAQLSLLQLAVLALAVLLGRSRAGSSVLEVIDQAFKVLLGIELHLRQNYFVNLVSNDFRFIATITACLVAVGVWIICRCISLRDLLLLPIILLSFSNQIDEMVSTFKEPISPARIEMNLGPGASRSVGEFIRVSSDETDLIATNHLFDSSGNLLSDFSLAVWAEREFLVLGPRFGGEISGRKAEAIEHSVQFADLPTTDTCRPLEQAGVKWFVVDLQLTDTRNWSECADKVFSDGNFTLLSMRYPKIISN